MLVELVSNSDFVIFLQLGLATIFGMILGIERVLVGRTAGPRTYGLVALGACLLTIVASISLKTYQANGIAVSDPYPFLGAIITGIGFIGAGLIVFRQSHLSGLTTAAGIWVAAAIGITVGFELYMISFFATFLTLFIFTVMWRLERVIKSKFGIIVDESSHES